jgi:hypothetical protein
MTLDSLSKICLVAIRTKLGALADVRSVLSIQSAETAEEVAEQAPNI